MSQFSLVFGERIRLSDGLYHLLRKVGGDKWQLEKDSNGEYRIMEETELLDLYFQNLMSFVTTHLENQVEEGVVNNKVMKTFSDFPEKLQQLAKCKLSYIRSIENITGEAAIEALLITAKKNGENNAPNISTVRRWSVIFVNSNSNICSLIPNYSSRGNRKPRYSEEVIKIAVREINSLYMNKNRASLDETLSAVRNAIEIENRRLPDNEKMPKPQRKFLRNLIAAMDAYEVERARYGKNAANRRFREVNSSGEIIAEPLLRVEIDHTVLDLIVVDADTYLPLGRPTITIIIDRCTRCICGYHVGYDPPSYISVMKCLSHAIKPKEYIKTNYPDIESNWPCWGIPELVVVDNGREFHSKDLEAAALSLLIDIRYCPVAQPWLKGAVERFFRTMGKSIIHMAPGTTFSNIKDKGDYNSVKMAVITEADVNELLHTWICDVYHQAVHRSTLRTPISLWRERISSIRQTLPESIEALDVNLASIEHRTLFHYGVSLNNLNYNSRNLQALRRKYGELNVQIRWDRSNLGAVHILDEAANVYIKVPCTWSNYAEGLSLWLHKAIRNEALSHEGPESEAKLDEAKARVRAIYEKALGNKKLATRKNAARAKQSFAEDTRAIPLPIIDQDYRPAGIDENNQIIVGEDNEQIEEIPYFEVVDRNSKSTKSN